MRDTYVDCGKCCMTCPLDLFREHSPMTCTQLGASSYQVQDSCKILSIGPQTGGNETMHMQPTGFCSHKGNLNKH